MPVVIWTDSFKLVFELNIIGILRILFILISKEFRVEVSLIIVVVRLRFLMIDGRRIWGWGWIVVNIYAVNVLLNRLSRKCQVVLIAFLYGFLQSRDLVAVEEAI